MKMPRLSAVNQNYGLDQVASSSSWLLGTYKHNFNFNCQSDRRYMSQFIISFLCNGKTFFCIFCALRYRFFPLLGLEEIWVVRIWGRYLIFSLVYLRDWVLGGESRDIIFNTFIMNFMMMQRKRRENYFFFHEYCIFTTKSVHSRHGNAG